MTFEYKNPDAVHEFPGERTGRIAQEVEAVFPDCVETGSDGIKRLTVRGSEALTVEALRQLREEQDAENAGLKRERSELKALTMSLDRRLRRAAE